MLLPGFQDAHVHPPSSGLEMLRCDLTLARSLPEYERIIAGYRRGDAYVLPISVKLGSGRRR